MDKHDLAQKLIDLQDSLEELSSECKRMEGRHENIIDRLKTDFSLEPEEVEVQLEALDRDLANIEESMEKMLDEIEKELDNDPDA